MSDDRTTEAVFEELEDLVLLIAAPSEPMAVARQFVTAHYERDDVLLLIRHGGNWYQYDGTCWPELAEVALRTGVYRWTEHTVYKQEKTTKEGTTERLMPWHPNRYKVADAVDALVAVVLLDSDAVAPCWIHDTVGADAAGGERDYPATEVVAMRNGLLHLPTRMLLPHTPAFFVHHALPFEYDPDAPEPVRWLTFLDDLWEDDSEAIDTLQEAMGYVLSGDRHQQKIFLLIGPKRSGKGTIGRVLTGLLGHHNVASPTLAGIATNFGLSPLIDRPLALVSDARLSGRTDASIVVERLLSISGEDMLTVDRKYRDPWTGYFPTRFWILTNELPHLTDSSGAFASRFIALILTKSFYGREDQTLTEQLLAEAPAIFNWCLEGLDRLRKRGAFVQPESAREAVEALEDLASPVRTFVEERCETRADYAVPAHDLYRAWRGWCDEHGLEPTNVALFGRDLRAVVPSVRKERPRAGEARLNQYRGIRLYSSTR